MKNRNILLSTSSIALLTASAALWGTPYAWAAKVLGVDFNGKDDPNVILIKGDAPLTFEKQENPADNQVVIEVKDAQIAKNLTRKIDTSSFNSKVTLISPYQLKDANAVRVVIQMREPGQADVTADGNNLKVSIPSSGSSDGAAAPSSAKTDASPASPAAEGQPAPGTEAAPGEPAAKTETTGAPKNRLEEFADAQSSSNFTGKPITLNVRDADVGDVMRLIGEASGFNIIMTDDVKGKISLSLTDVPWDQALQLVLQTMRLGAERNNNVLRITTLANLTTEKQEQLKATQAAQAAAPRVTRQFPISYAKLPDLEKTLKQFANAGTSVGQTNDSVVQLDDRTNSIMVRDTAENIEKMKKLIELLDTQTPQVLIEAKVVEATEGFNKQLSGALGFGSGGTTLASFNGGATGDPLIGTPSVQTLSGTPNNGGAFMFSPDLTAFSNNLRLNALLQIQEQENQVKIVSSPRVVVLNKGTANILQGTPVAFTTTTTSTTSTGTSITQSTTTLDANLDLEVTPTVTNDGSILMDLKIDRDVPTDLVGTQAVGKRKIKTTVLVENGSTLSIGGIFITRDSENSGGFPFLRKIPIIGWLFGFSKSVTEKTELFIFITPRILNPRESGMTQSNNPS